MAEKTSANGNIGVAYTYNEPLINYEFLYDCAKLIRKAGMCNVIVSNGFINPEPLEELLPHIDAMNIDLKGFSDKFYKKLGAKRADSTNAVKQAITLAHKHCHVEITTLVIPGENEDEIEPLCEWIASIDDKIPLHLNRFFPRFMYSDKAPTPLQTLHRLSEIAKKYLENVFIGNV
jgi:pyruvate formate lyase activating enzyme